MNRLAWLTGEVPAVGNYICRRLLIPNELSLIMAVSGALLELTKEENWEQLGSLTPDAAAQLMSQLYEDYLGSDACMLGLVVPYASSVPPSGCLPCDGSSHNREDYPRLYEVLDSAWVVNADTFQTPDLSSAFTLPYCMIAR